MVHVFRMEDMALRIPGHGIMALWLVPALYLSWLLADELNIEWPRNLQSFAELRGNA